MLLLAKEAKGSKVEWEGLPTEYTEGMACSGWVTTDAALQRGEMISEGGALVAPQIPTRLGERANRRKILGV